MENKFEIEVTGKGIKRKLTYEGNTYEDYMIKEGFRYKTVSDQSIELQLLEKFDYDDEEEIFEIINSNDLTSIMYLLKMELI